MSFFVEAACDCNRGKVRSNNEDNFCFDNRCLEADNQGLRHPVEFRRVVRPGLCVSVFDGMGGEDFGEIASFTAAQSMQAEIKRLKQFFVPERKFLEQMCQRLNLDVFHAAQKLGTERMGSTMVTLYFEKNEVYVCNLGDSRAFRLREGEFMQLSKDHTDSYEVIERGVKKRKPHLTQHLGIDPEEMIIEPYIAKGELRRGDQYLLCSDGLTDMLTNFEICDLMQRSDSAEGCVQALVQAALEHGGKDNVTVIVCRIS